MNIGTFSPNEARSNQINLNGCQNGMKIGRMNSAKAYQGNKGTGMRKSSLILGMA